MCGWGGGLGRQVSGGVPTPQPTSVTCVSIWVAIRSTTHLDVVIWVLDRIHLDWNILNTCSKLFFQSQNVVELRNYLKTSKMWKTVKKHIFINFHVFQVFPRFWLKVPAVFGQVCGHLLGNSIHSAPKRCHPSS